MINSYMYEVLKSFENSKGGLTQTEYGNLDLINEEKKDYHIKLNDLLNEYYIEAQYHTVDIHAENWQKNLKYDLTKEGKKAIASYEKWLNHPHTCTQQKVHAATKYVIVEHRSACYGTGGVHYMSYTSNMGFTHDLSKATLYSTKEEAEEDIATLIKDSPMKYQNPEDYEFSVEEVKVTMNVELPKTYICKDCGKRHPIQDYYITTYCPLSWNTGVCEKCRCERERKKREAMYERNRRGVFDYDSFD